MRPFFVFLLVVALLAGAAPAAETSFAVEGPVISSPASPAPTVWNAGNTTFSQTVSGQRDCITPQTCLSRVTVIYNTVMETVSGQQGCTYAGPANTEWAKGTIANWNTLIYQRLYLVNECSPPNMVNYPLVLHLIAENIYLQVQFTSWTGHAGRFVYNRTTMPAAAVNVSVTGRVFTSTGNPIRNASVVFQNGASDVRYAITSSLGYYTFDNVLTGATYTISISSKRYTFNPLVLTVTGEVTSADLTALPDPT